jgi:N-methylhydantoinase B
VEVEEWDTPYRWLHYEFRPDSGGDGEWRGGAGTELKIVNTYDPNVWQPLDCVVMTGNSDGEKFTHTGLMGGTDGNAHRLGIVRKGEDVQLRCMDVQYLHPGDLIWTQSGGGGGYGDPLDRAIEKVRWDALNEYISVERARDVYGVIIDPESFEVDYAATRELRNKLKEQKNAEGSPC